MNLSDWNPPKSTPDKPDEYRAALAPLEAVETCRRYWNGHKWSNPYLSTWPERLKAIARSQECEFFPYWMTVDAKN